MSDDLRDKLAQDKIDLRLELAAAKGRIAALEAAIDDIDLIANAVRSEYDGSPADIALAVHVAIKGRLTDTGENLER